METGMIRLRGTFSALLLVLLLRQSFNLFCPSPLSAAFHEPIRTKQFTIMPPLVLHPQSSHPDNQILLPHPHLDIPQAPIPKVNYSDSGTGAVAFAFGFGGASLELCSVSFKPA